MSQSSRSLEQDILRAAGTYRLSDALELVSGSSQQNNRGGFADNFAIRGFLSTADGGGEYYTDGFIANRGSAPHGTPRRSSASRSSRALPVPSSAISIPPDGSIWSARRRVLHHRRRLRCTMARSTRVGSNWTRRGR
ncbi:TonB-dependent receptor plug domain-containing protein [Sphingomonas aerolata]